MSNTTTIELTADFGAVSVNRLYTRNRYTGRKILTKEGKRYQRTAVSQMLQAWGLGELLDPNAAYKISMTFYMPRVLTKGWPDKAKFRFVKIDQANLVKFFQDCVSTASGVDDSNFVSMVVDKKEDPENPRVEIILEQIEWTPNDG